jgi:hypothetical protein
VEINEKKLKTILKEQSKEQLEELQRQNGVLYEKFRTDIKIIGEGLSTTREKVTEIAESLVLTNEKVETMSIKLDATFNMVGSLKKDVEVVKEDVEVVKENVEAVKKDVRVMKEDAKFMKKDMEIVKEDTGVIKMDIFFIKNGLKEKADKDELIALEKRVLFLENKLKRI